MSSSHNTDCLDITHESLSEYLRSTYPDRHLTFEYYPNLLTELTVELRNSILSTIGNVHKTLERTKKAAERFEVDNQPSRLVDSRYSAIGIVKISISLLYNDFFISRPTVLDNCSPEKLEEYRKLILPE